MTIATAVPVLIRGAEVEARLLPAATRRDAFDGVGRGSVERRVEEVTLSLPTVPQTASVNAGDSVEVMATENHPRSRTFTVWRVRSADGRVTVDASRYVE